MVRGEGGKVGILGNVGSTSYGSHSAGQGPTPPLSASSFVIYYLQASDTYADTHDQ
jgi:hypothetical protein